MISAQGFEQRGPGNSEHGSRERAGVAVNMVTPEQLTQWMETSKGSKTATPDQWCYAMGQLVGGFNCPAPEKFGFGGNMREARVDAQTFLNNLRGYQAGGYAPVATGESRDREASPGVAACRHAVQDRLRDEGYYEVHIPSINAEDRPGGADRVYGLADAQGRSGRSEEFDFSCAVNLERGEVHSVDVNHR
jgi:hypothetical protein